MVPSPPSGKVRVVSTGASNSDVKAICMLGVASMASLNVTVIVSTCPGLAKSWEKVTLAVEEVVS